jgi:hypothetical protein
MGGLDYPYLTYNDLYDLQNKLLLDTGATNAVLTTLMDRKRQSMDAQGITGYKGWQAQE